MSRHNAHVLIWYRWQHFLAEQQCRPFAMLVWSTCYAQEARHG